MIHTIEWITGVETIKRQTRAAYGCLVARKSPVAASLAAAYIHVCTPVLSVTQQRRCSCSCRSWRYISIMPLPFTFLLEERVRCPTLFTERDPWRSDVVTASCDTASERARRVMRMMITRLDQHDYILHRYRSRGNSSSWHSARPHTQTRSPWDCIMSSCSLYSESLRL